VLKAPDIPSILVETAFISNPDEEKKLTDEDYQDQMADAIVAGIKRYFEKNPPLARNKVSQSYRGKVQDAREGRFFRTLGLESLILPLSQLAMH